MKQFAASDEKYSMSFRLLTVKNNSHEDIRTSHAQVLEKGCQHGEEDSKHKIFHETSTSLVQKSRQLK